GEERLIARTEHPPGARLALVRIPGMADGGVVRDRPGAADAWRTALPRAELLEAVGFRTDATQEGAAVLAHRSPPDVMLSRLCRRSNGMTFRQARRLARCRTGHSDSEPGEQAQHGHDLEHRRDAEGARDHATEGGPHDRADVEARVVDAGRKPYV